VNSGEGKGKFDLVTINPPMVFGPLAKAQYVSSPEAVNTSNERIVDLVKGRWKTNGTPATGAAIIWVDVRDVARAHVKAGLELGEEVSGKRLFVVSGEFSNAEIARVVKKRFPEFEGVVPDEEGLKTGEIPPEDKRFRWDNSATRRLLGFEWIGLEESIVDAVESIKAL